MKVIPILNEPALVVNNTIKALVIADVHLGIEWELYHRGFSIPSQVEKRKKRICDYLENANPDRIVLLGDIKHNVPRTSWQERKEVPDFRLQSANELFINQSSWSHSSIQRGMRNPVWFVTLKTS